MPSQFGGGAGTVSQFGDGMTANPGTGDGSVVIQSITLIGTVAKIIHNSLYGNRQVRIECTSVGGPMLSVHIAKRIGTDAPTITANHSRTSADGNRLELVWNDNEELKFRKTSNTFNVAYLVTVS